VLFFPSERGGSSTDGEQRGDALAQPGNALLLPPDGADGRERRLVREARDLVVSMKKQQHQHQPAPSAACANDDAADRKVEPLIVFDWDDTILTSSWIQVNDLLQATSYDELPPEVQRDLSQLERR